MELNYEKDIEIDGQSLDQEWLRQASIFAKYSRELAYLDRAAKLADEHVKTVRSELIEKINKDPEKYLGKDIKATDAKVEAAYRQQSVYIKSKEARIEAEYQRDLVKVAVDAFNYHRKAALEGLVTLHGQNYFAGPSVPHDIGREFRKQVDAKGKEDARDKTTERTTRGRRG